MASNSSLATMKAIKREAPDDEPMIVENPMKRRAVESHDTPQINGAIPSHRPALVTEDQLRGKSSDELVQVVLQLQSSYSEQVADLKGQYATLSSQLNDLKATLAAFFTANLAALQSLSKTLINEVAQIPHAGPEQTPPANPQPRPTISHSPRQSFRSFSVSNLANASQKVATSLPTPTPPGGLPMPGPTSRLDHDQQAEMTMSPSPAFSTPASVTAASSFSAINQTPATGSQPSLPAVTQPTGDGPPIVECTTFNTVKEIWQEYRYGVPDQPAAIETLDATWGPRWRPEAKIRTWYSRRKLVYDKIKELIADGIDEATAVQEVEAMRRGRTINWLMRLLQEDRKDTRASWKAAAAAATAAAQVVHSRPSLESPTPAAPGISFQRTSL